MYLLRVSDISGFCLTCARLLTPSGRFEINKRICLSMSDFHKEHGSQDSNGEEVKGLALASFGPVRSWNPSWTVEKILIGLMSFMYEAPTNTGALLYACVAAQPRGAGAACCAGMCLEANTSAFCDVRGFRRTPCPLARFWSPKRIDGDMLQPLHILMLLGCRQHFKLCRMSSTGLPV